MLKFFSKSEYQDIADSFALGNIIQLKHFSQGFQTPKAVIITRKGEFVISRHKPDSLLQDEIDLLNSLKDLPIPRYVKSRLGKSIEDYKNFAVSAYRFLPGSRPQTIRPTMAFQIGKFLGSFHKQGKNFKKTLLGRRRFYDLPDSVIKMMNKIAIRQTNFKLKEIVAEVKAGVIENKLPEILPRGPVHVDMKPENELFIKSKLTGVIDFGNFYRDAFLLDIGKAIMWNCVSRGMLDLNLAQQLISGYEMHRSLSAMERRNLTRSILFAVYSHIWVDLYHVPLGYVPESYVLGLVKEFLPVARKLQLMKL